MARDRVYREWRLQEVLPAELTVEQARDILLDCFYTTHGDHFLETKSQLGVMADEKAVRRASRARCASRFGRCMAATTPPPSTISRTSPSISPRSPVRGNPRGRHQTAHGRDASRLFPRA